MLPFTDRRAAGRALAQHLSAFAGRDDVTVVALPRGGVPVAFEIAKALGASLDVFVVGNEPREDVYRGTSTRRPLDGRTLIVVYDGMLTGESMCAAVRALRDHRPARIIVAVPVASAAACRAVERVSDGCICLETPEPFFRTALWYEDFTRVQDADAIAMLAVAAMSRERAA